MPETKPRFIKLADGCVRDATTLYLNEAGQWCYFEFTPILNSDNSMTRAGGGEKLVADCTLAGGGWQMTSVREEVSIRNYARYNPASDVPNTPASGFVLTRDDDVSPPSGFVWAVGLHGGYVRYVGPSASGFVRGGRLVPASQSDLAFGPAQ